MKVQHDVYPHNYCACCVYICVSAYGLNDTVPSVCLRADTALTQHTRKLVLLQITDKRLRRKIIYISNNACADGHPFRIHYI